MLKQSVKLTIRTQTTLFSLMRFSHWNLMRKEKRTMKLLVIKVQTQSLKTQLELSILPLLSNTLK